MAAPLKFSSLSLPLIRTVMVTVQLRERVWLFSLPIHPNDQKITPFLLETESDINLYCAVVNAEQLYPPIWSGKYDDCQTFLRFIERVIEAVSYFLSVLESGAVDKEYGLIGIDFYHWQQFLNIIDAFSKSLHLGRKLTKKLTRKVSGHELDPIKFKGLIKEILHNHFLPHEVASVGKSRFFSRK